MQVVSCARSTCESGSAGLGRCRLVRHSLQPCSQGAEAAERQQHDVSGLLKRLACVRRPACLPGGTLPLGDGWRQCLGCRGDHSAAVLRNPRTPQPPKLVGRRSFELLHKQCPGLWPSGAGEAMARLRPHATQADPQQLFRTQVETSRQPADGTGRLQRT